MSVAQTFTVTVVSTGGGNKYFIDGVQQDTVMIGAGLTYRFDQSDGTNSGHPLRFSTTDNGTHSGGVQYTTGVTTNGIPGNAGAYTQIEVQNGAPSTLYYYCTIHSGMGGQANTDGWGRSTWSQMDWGDSNVIETGWGRNTWGYQSWGDTPIVTLTGLSSSTAIGSLDIEIKPGWGTLSWGINGWGSVETATEVLPGLALTSSLGSINLADQLMGLTGLSATSAVGSLSVDTSLSLTLPNQGLISSLGLLETADSVGLSGQSATTSLGSIIATPATGVVLSGVSATSNVGNLTISGALLLPLSGQSATTSLGSISPADVMGLTGLSSTSALGSLTTVQVTNASLVGLGLSLTAEVGEFNAILGYADVDPVLTASYSDVTRSVNASYTDVDSVG